MLFKRTISKNIEITVMYQSTKKESKNLIKSYWPISLLLLIFSKILERLIFNFSLIILNYKNFLLSVTLVLFWGTAVLHSYYELLMKFANLLFVAYQQILKEFFLTVWHDSLFFNNFHKILLRVMVKLHAINSAVLTNWCGKLSKSIYFL